MVLDVPFFFFYLLLLLSFLPHLLSLHFLIYFSFSLSVSSAFFFLLSLPHASHAISYIFRKKIYTVRIRWSLADFSCCRLELLCAATKKHYKAKEEIKHKKKYFLFGFHACRLLFRRTQPCVSLIHTAPYSFFFFCFLERLYHILIGQIMSRESSEILQRKSEPLMEEKVIKFGSLYLLFIIFIFSFLPFLNSRALFFFAAVSSHKINEAVTGKK